MAALLRVPGHRMLQLTKASRPAQGRSCWPRAFATWTQEPPGFREKPRSRTRKGVELPTGWTECHSPSRGVYFSHSPTGVTQWDFPTGPPSTAQVEQVKAERGQRYDHRSSDLHPGAQVRLVGLQLPDLEGKTGTCVQFDTDGYVRVRLSSGELKAVKPKNLMLVQTAGSHPVLGSTRVSQEATPKSREGWRGRRVAGTLLVCSMLGLIACFVVPQPESTESQPDAATVREVPQQPVVSPASSPQPLPPGWREHLDPASGRLYYWREDNPAATTTWVRPSA